MELDGVAEDCQRLEKMEMAIFLLWCSVSCLISRMKEGWSEVESSHAGTHKPSGIETTRASNHAARGDVIESLSPTATI